MDSQAPREYDLLVTDPGYSNGGHPAHPGLDCLADTDANQRPPYSSYILIRYAILGSPKQKLTLSEIYSAIANRFPWFNTAGQTWKNSIRHCLSIDPLFEKESRHISEPGRGYYWKISQDPSRNIKRPRKRGKKPDLYQEEEESETLTSKLSDSSARPSQRVDMASSGPQFDKHGNFHEFHNSTSSGWMPYFPFPRQNLAHNPLTNGNYVEITPTRSRTGYKSVGVSPTRKFLVPEPDSDGESRYE